MEAGASQENIKEGIHIWTPSRAPHSDMTNTSNVRLTSRLLPILSHYSQGATKPEP